MNNYVLLVQILTWDTYLNVWKFLLGKGTENWSITQLLSLKLVNEGNISKYIITYILVFNSNTNIRNLFNGYKYKTKLIKSKSSKNMSKLVHKYIHIYLY